MRALEIIVPSIKAYCTRLTAMLLVLSLTCNRISLQYFCIHHQMNPALRSTATIWMTACQNRAVSEGQNRDLRGRNNRAVSHTICLLLSTHVPVQQELLGRDLE